jgi:hypothetical protein
MIALKPHSIAARISVVTAILARTTANVASDLHCSEDGPAFFIRGYQSQVNSEPIKRTNKWV